MADTDTIINGYQYQFSSLELSVILPNGSSEIFITIGELSYSEQLEVAFVMGANQGPVGWTAGVYTPQDGSFSVAKADLMSRLIEKVGNGWMTKRYKIVAKYNDEGQPICVDEMVVRIVSNEDSGTAGTADALMSKIGFKPFLIKRNNITPLAQHLGA
jgi:hypothetical protein